MSKRVAILQSNYLPWKGYFDIIAGVDLFVFYDDVQYTNRDWRNRNRIKTSRGLEWITVPCGADRGRLVCEVELKDASWQRKHWKTLRNVYGRAEHFEYCRPFLDELYLNRHWTNLSDLNRFIIQQIAGTFLGLTTQFRDSRELTLREKKADRILELLQQVGATQYLSGPAAKAYLDPTAFERAGIELTWMDYSGYPEYTQFHGPFVHEVSIVDLLFHEGPDAARYLKFAGRRS